MRGTRYLIASLYAERGPSGHFSRFDFSSGSNDYGGVALNHLFYDLDSRSTRWLFPGLGQRILDTLPLTTASDVTTDGARATPREGGDSRVRAFLYRVVTQDTNGDGALKGDDRSDLAASDPGGSGYTVLVASTGRFFGAFWVDEVHVLLIFEKDGAVQGVEFDVDKQKVTRQVRFPVTLAPAA